jgi:hypothetical protein
MCILLRVPSRNRSSSYPSIPRLTGHPVIRSNFQSYATTVYYSGTQQNHASIEDRWLTSGYLKGKSAVRLHRELLHERRMTGLQFWVTRYSQHRRPG